MAQNFPPGFGTRNQQAASTGTSKVSVAQSAIDSAVRNEDYAAEQAAFERGTSVREVRRYLSDAEVTRIAKVVTGKSPSPRTLRRWAAEDRVPHADLARALERHRFVKANGGVDELAQMAGRSTSSVRKWMTGRQENFRGDAKAIVAAARIRERMIRGGMMSPDGQLKRPVIHLKASLYVRMPGESKKQKGYSYTIKSRVLNMEDSTDTGMPEDEAMSLAIALATNRTADALAIISEHASTSYASFPGFSDDMGFHIDHVDDWGLSWE